MGFCLFPEIKATRYY